MWMRIGWKDTGHKREGREEREQEYQRMTDGVGVGEGSGKSGGGVVRRVNEKYEVEWKWIRERDNFMQRQGDWRGRAYWREERCGDKATWKRSGSRGVEVEG